MSAKIRNLVKGEELPEILRTGFEAAPSTDEKWIFVAERDGKPVGILVAAPAHLTVILLRLIMTKEAHSLDVRTLLMQAFKTFEQRGYLGYITWLDPSTPVEGALLTVLEAAGGIRMPVTQVLCVGRA